MIFIAGNTRQQALRVGHQYLLKNKYPIINYAVESTKQGHTVTQEYLQLIKEIPNNKFSIALKLSSFDFDIHKVSQIISSAQQKNIKVLVIPDFEDLMTENQALAMNWEVFIPAVFDHDLRLALYEMATDNYCINNGVIVPLMHSEARYKLFKWLTPGVKTCSPEWSKNVWGKDGN